MKTTSSSTKTVRSLRWVARILGIILVAFFLYFFIPDIIRKGGLPNTDLGNRLLLILFGIGLVGLLIAWRWERIGGFMAAISFILFGVMKLTWVHGGQNSGRAAIIYLIPALLFIYCWWRTRKQPEQDALKGDPV